jgi:regulator of nonsense transcripts 3
MPPQRAAKASPQPSVGAKSAFLKHANPSQGITEELLQTIFKEFGPIARCEIDKKKGLGYVDFTETESLKKAMQASPVKVGNGQVVVLENRPQYGNKRGAGPPTRGQTQLPANPKSAAPIAAASSTLHTNMPATVSPAPATASRAPATVRPEQTQTTPTTTQASTVTPPTASTAPTAPRGGGSGGRGGGVTTGGPRGGGRNPSQGSRGRGGRGTQGRRGGAAAAASVNAPTVSKVNTTVAPSAEVKKE